MNNTRRKQKMKRKTFVAVLLMAVVVLILAACGGSLPSIEGRWELDGVVLEFLSDGTGVETFGSDAYEFNWRIRGSTLEMDFLGNPIDSPINYVLSLELHGAPVGAFEFFFSDDGQVLNLTDDHGHGHFVLDFTRLED